MTPLPDLNKLTGAEKDALILILLARLEAAEKRIADLEARPGEPARTSDTSSLPPSQGHKANQPDKARREGPRQGSLGRKGGGRPLAKEPDQFVIAKATACAHCRAGLDDTDQVVNIGWKVTRLPPRGLGIRLNLTHPE